MKTYGLTGKSGTGKSYQAINLCRVKKIEYIIDDGLLISGTGILAGTSAKREATKVGAVKTALFTSDEHRDEVARRIAQSNPESILVLGTSENMIHRIADRLALPPVSEMIHIEDITTPQQREIARTQREDLGKHIIPAPTFHVKRQFSGYFLDPMRIFRNRFGAYSERTVVRPTYSYLGEFIISDRVIQDIVNLTGRDTKGVAEVLRVNSQNGPDGLKLKVVVTLYYGHHILPTASAFQKAVISQIELMTAFNVLSVDVDVKGVTR